VVSECPNDIIVKVSCRLSCHRNLALCLVSEIGANDIAARSNRLKSQSNAVTMRLRSLRANAAVTARPMAIIGVRRRMLVAGKPYAWRWGAASDEHS
jgi:hypothetical protein